MRAAILGNSGSGKSTFARALAQADKTAILDLDTIVWEPRQIAVRRPANAVLDDLERFTSSHTSWIVEGCYGDLIETLLAARPELIFMNPGLERCILNCKNRPHEPHKYPSKAEQDRRLEFLLGWVADYYTRTGPMSLAAHRQLFDAYRGPKREIEG